MKFGNSLKDVSGIYSQYVTYRTLKKLVRAIELAEEEGKSRKEPEITARQLWWFDSTTKTSISNISTEEVAFIRNLENEIVRVKRLHGARYSELKDQLNDVFRRIHGGFDRDMLSSELDSIARQLVALERFVRQSKVLFYKILKKHDKRTPLQVGTWMLVRLEQEPFWTAAFDDIVIGLSDAYAEVRALIGLGPSGKGAQVRDGAEEGAEDFVRKTQKFLIKSDDIMFIKTTVIKYLPLDIFGRKKDPGEGAGPVDYAAYLDSLRNYKDASVINSIYLDNEPLDMYHDRMGLEGARGNLIRVRWYGDHANPPLYLFMERKTRRPFGTYTIDEAVKERFRIKETNMVGYLTGEWNMAKKLENMLARKMIKKEAAEKLWITSNDIQLEILGKELGAAVRTVCRRSAFQQGKDQSLRLSLDTNLHMIDETDTQRDPSKRWYRDLSKALKMSEVVKFPYAVLEIKTQTDPPAWVIDLQNSGVLIDGDRYSKFLYGTAKFRTNGVRYPPPWLERISMLEREPPITPKLVSLYEPDTASGVSSSGTTPQTLSVAPSPVAVRSSLGAQPARTSSPATSRSASPMPSEKTLAAMAVSKAEKVRIPPPATSSKLEVKVVSMPGGPMSSARAAGRLLEAAGPVDEQLEAAGAAGPPAAVPAEDELRAAGGAGSSKYAPFADQQSRGKFAPLQQFSDVHEPASAVVKIGAGGGGGGGRGDKGGPPGPPAFFSGGGGGAGGKGGGKGAAKSAAKDNKKLLKAASDKQRTAKTFFANERTLLSWVNTVTFLSLTGVTLLNTRTQIGHVFGIAMVFITVAFAIYALTRYVRRLRGLKEENFVGFEDKVGPAILIGIFCLVLLFMAVYYGGSGLFWTV